MRIPASETRPRSSPGSRAFRPLGLATALAIASAGAWAPDVSSDSPFRVSGAETCARAKRLLGGAYRAPDPADDRGYDVQHYDLTLDVGTTDIDGAVTITARALEDDFSEVVLDLADAYILEAVTSGSHGVAGHDHRDDALAITLETPVAAGEVFSVTVDYLGTPPIIGGSVATPPFNWSTHGVQEDGTLGPVIFTLSVPDRSGAWWPCKEQLEDKATIDLAITVDDPLVVASNGVLVATEPLAGARTTYRWSHGHPIVPYLVCLAISDYDVFEETMILDVPGEGPVTIPLTYFVYPEKRAAAESDFRRIPEAITYYSSLFGPYPFRDEKYAMAMIPWSGGMEHQTCVSLGGGFVQGSDDGSDPPGEDVFVHELAHQWFGDSVGLRDLRDMWLNEGFATYCEALWAEHLGGYSAYAETMREFDAFAPPRNSGFLGTIWDPDPLYGSTPYRKGAWVLHMLRWKLRASLGETDGTVAFFDVLSEHARSRVAGNTSTDEFIDLAEGVSGVELRDFVEQWLYTVGRPDFAMTWTSAPEGPQYRYTIRIQQKQPQRSVFDVPVQIDIVDTASDTTRIVVDTNARQVLATGLTDREATEVRFDPTRNILRYIPISPYSPVTSVVAFAEALPNPLRTESRVRYSLFEDARVTLRVYDVFGRVVRTLVDGERQLARAHAISWDGTDAAGKPLGSGRYYLQLDAGRESRTASILVVR